MTLKVENLGKTYPGGVDALADFSLEMGEAELVAVVGPSGCGKSTLLRLLAGLEEEGAGTMRLGDKILNGLPPKDRDIAIMFQSFTLLPHLTVAENLAFGLRLRGLGKEERAAKAREAAALLGIENLLPRYPSEISGGERQRAALGRAILRQPRLFLFDEPLSSLDAQMRQQLRLEIQRLHRRLQVPMLFVTHDQSEAMSLGDRVAVLDKGRLQQIAAPEELYRRPANTFVAAFIGNPGMNLFRGRIEDGDGGTRFASPSLSFALNPDRAARLPRGEAVAGLRPEQLRLNHSGPLRGQVTAREIHPGGGHCAYLESPAGTSFAFKSAGVPEPASGAALAFDFPPEAPLFFDASGFLLNA